MALTQFDIPLTTLETQLVSWTTEALDLRFDPANTLPPSESSQRQVLDSLLEIRGRLDRLEGLFARATRAKGRTYRASQVAKAAAEDAWDSASVTERAKPARKGIEFTSGRERQADANLTTIMELRAAREAAHLAEVANETLDVVRICYRGLEGLRHDHLAILRSFNFEAHLERATPDRGY